MSVIYARFVVLFTLIIIVGGYVLCRYVVTKFDTPCVLAQAHAVHQFNAFGENWCILCARLVAGLSWCSFVCGATLYCSFNYFFYYVFK